MTSCKAAVRGCVLRVALVLLLNACLGGVSLSQCHKKPNKTLEQTLKEEASTCSRQRFSTVPCPLGSQHAATTAYALMKDCDEDKPAGYLVVPTKVVHGIESTTTLDDRTYRHLWRDTWTWAKRFPDVNGDWTALAVNAQTARGIDQLHIHVSCVSKEVRDELIKQSDAIPLWNARTPQSVLLTLSLHGWWKDSQDWTASYRAVRVHSLSNGDNPFLVSNSLTRYNRSTSAEKTPQDVAVIGTTHPNEYIVLTFEEQAEKDNRGLAEALMDETCVDARSQSTPRSQSTH